MTKRITPERLAFELASVPEVIDHEIIIGLKEAASKVKQTARDKFGTYQPSYGEFPGWALLNWDYLVQKYAAGSPGDMPLIGYYFDDQRARRDEIWPDRLRDSLDTKIDAINLIAYVGTDNPLGEWHEFGLPDRENPLPPRPFLRPALYQNQDWIHVRLRDSVALGLMRWFG